MYSPKVRKILSSAGIKPGDRIRVERPGKVYEGLLMPKTEFSDPNSIVIKLDSGYNMGIAFGRGVKIRKMGSGRGTGAGGMKAKFGKGKPKISLVSTGGTIASRVDYRTGGVYAASSPEEILSNVPELADIADIHEMLSPVNKMSEDFSPKDWVKTAKVVHKRLNSEDMGVIVTHGTDTMHFTSAALSFFLRNLAKPVVLAGAQRSSDRGSSDAGMNLVCAAHVSVSDVAEVGICMHGEMSDSFCLFIRGTKARKMHTSRRDAFRPINENPIAKVWPDGRMEWTNMKRRKRGKGETELDARFEERVAMLKVYPGADPEIMDFYVSKGYRGFVIEGTGLGHVPTFAEKSWIKSIKKHVKDGIPFVVTSQTLYGRVNPDVYTNLRILFREAGAIPGEDMLPETAYVKLGWVLGHTQDMEEIRKRMLTDYAGEITERSVPEGFLM